MLVPGQIITAEVLDFMSALDTREIHGYEARLGYRVILPKTSADAESRAPSLSSHTEVTALGPCRR